MKRRCFGVLVVLLPILALGCGAHASQPPNIVLVLLDDYATSDEAYLPRLRELTSERGMSFGMIIPSPRCAPSRASILSGKYVHNHRIIRNGEHATGGGWKALRDIESTLFACWIQPRGYTTHYAGKYFNGYGHHDPTAVPPCWNDWHVDTYPVGDSRFVFALNSNGTIEQHSGDAYQTDVLAEKTVDFIRDAHEPFLAVLAPLSPHTPLVAAPKYAGSLADLPITHPPSFNEADVSDKWRPRPLLTAADIADVDARKRVRLEMMRSVEDAIAAVWKALEEKGVVDRTYVFFTSDNGYFYGEHRIARGKAMPYREATELPLVVVGPGIAPGTRSSKLVLNNDLGPTFADLAGATTPEVDGHSFVPLLRGESPPWRRRALLEFFNPEGETIWHGVRTEHGVRVKWTNGPWESYDYAGDPYEQNGGRRESTALDALATCAGIECWREERGARKAPAATSSAAKN